MIARLISLAVTFVAITAPASGQGLERTLPADSELRRIVIPPEIAGLAMALASDDYGVRESAMDAMLALEPDLDTLCALLLDNTLEVETRYRLLAILRERVLNTPRGAVGIEVDQLRLARDEVVIARVLEGLPAAAVLRPGDRILELDREPLRDWKTFVEEIQLHLPGEHVQLTIERVDAETGTEIRQFDLRLGSAEKDRNERGQPIISNALENIRASIVRQAEFRFGVPPLTVLSSVPEQESVAPPRIFPIGD